MHLDDCNTILPLPDKTCPWQAKIFRIFVMCCTSRTNNIWSVNNCTFVYNVKVEKTFIVVDIYHINIWNHGNDSS